LCLGENLFGFFCFQSVSSVGLWHVCVLGMRVWLGAFLVFRWWAVCWLLVCVSFGWFADFSEDLFGDFAHVNFEEDDCDDYG